MNKGLSRVIVNLFIEHNCTCYHYGKLVYRLLMEGDFTNYDCFFTKVNNPVKKKGLFVKPKGRYIRAYCKGNWDKIPGTYDRMLQFASEQGLQFVGYAYEEGINEMAIKEIEEYITQIMIACK